MDPEAAAIITPHLLAREEILWCGRPHDSTSLRWRAGAIILVGIAALALRALPLDSSLAERADLNSILLAVLVCVLIAEAIVFNSYLSNTFYGVTNQRVIIVSGFKVYPNEVEDQIAKCPGVLEVAAVAQTDEHSGEVVALFIVRKDPSLTEQAVSDFAHQCLTAYKRPAAIYFREQLPKTNVGKILRRELRDELAKSRAAAPAA